MAFAAALTHKPGRTLAVVVFAGMLCGVIANALFFQTARHPAPIFQAAPIAARPAQAPAPAPLPPQRSSERSTAPQGHSALATPPFAAAPAKDQINALLSAGSPNATTGDSARVAAAQKALAKLGYVVKPDGVMGSGTRKAIEMFEQSRKLPTTGELSPRVTRELTALSGVAVP